MDSVSLVAANDPRHEEVVYWPTLYNHQVFPPPLPLSPFQLVPVPDYSVTSHKSLLTSQWALQTSQVFQQPHPSPLAAYVQSHGIISDATSAVPLSPRSTSSRVSTPELTASSTNSSPGTSPRLIHVVPTSDYEVAYSALDSDVKYGKFTEAPSTSSSSLGTSPTDSYLDAFSVKGEDYATWQVDEPHQVQLDPTATVFNPAQSLQLHPPIPKIDMHFYNELSFPLSHQDYKYALQPVVAAPHKVEDLRDQALFGPAWNTIQFSASNSPFDTSDSSSSSSVSNSPPSTPAVMTPKAKRKFKDLKTVKPETPAFAPRKVFGPDPPKAKVIIKRKIGRRSGPLRPDQRKQAGEIRKIRACLRCRFLKKTCDTGSPCNGCQAHHTRLWQVPCARVDVKDLGDCFLLPWTDDYSSTMNFRECDIVGAPNSERRLWVGHGFGVVLPLLAHEITVRKGDSLDIQWDETHLYAPYEFKVRTAALAVSSKDIDQQLLSDYLDRHVDSGWTQFVDEHFEGTPFLTGMLKSAHNYWQATNLPVVHKALKLILSYNLTLHITLVAGAGESDSMPGRIESSSSKYKGMVVAPSDINTTIKRALSTVWRDLHKEVLEELSTMISGYYGRDKLKNWATIYIVAYLVLTLWEEIRFDAIRRCRTMEEADTLCKNMDDVPVGVVVGLFAAISQKVPAFKDWSTPHHHEILNDDVAACQLMEEVREHILDNEQFLRHRAATAEYNANDYDSLASKFTAMLIKN